ncbi:MAG: sugar ABC transporter permease [Clostridiaceae bacterium]|nr:sugar ABC transporter permease [Clostridiaceae bacterium]
MEKALTNKLLITMLIFPALLIYSLVVPIPVIASVYYSFTTWNLIGEMRFSGLQNFINLFLHDDIFRLSIKNTIVFLFVSILLQEPAAFIFSVLLTKGVRGQKFFRNLFFMPVVFSGVSVSLMFYFIYHPDVGVVNNLIRLLGYRDFSFAWLGEEKTALLSVTVALAWQYIGYHMTIYISGISSIPGEMFEAAQIDGANEWMVIKHIIFPMVMPMIKVSMILITTSSLKAFDYIYIMTYGGPAHASEVIASHMYSKAFVQLKYGYGSAISTVLMVLCIISSVIMTKVFKDRVYSDG